MRLPGPLYESLPYAYVIAGTIFNVGIIYLGPNAPGARYYLALGIFCTIAGLVVFGRRQIRRHRQTNIDAKEVEAH